MNSPSEAVPPFPPRSGRAWEQHPQRLPGADAIGKVLWYLPSKQLFCDPSVKTQKSCAISNSISVTLSRSKYLVTGLSLTHLQVLCQVHYVYLINVVGVFNKCILLFGSTLENNKKWILKASLWQVLSWFYWKFWKSNDTMWALYSDVYKDTITDLPKVTRGASTVAAMRHRVSWLWIL